MPTLLVFGARNLGRIVARELAADGWSVAAVARSEETLDALRIDVPDALTLRADASLVDDVERVLGETRERFGPPDLIVNAITDWPQRGSILELEPGALEPYVQTLVPAIFNVLRLGVRELAARGGGTFVQVTGGSARRGMPGRGPWAAAAFATRALVQSAAADVREQGVHVALLIVDAVIESEKTAQWLQDEPPEKSASMEEVARAVAYLYEQSPRGWTHELQLTPSLERWVP